MDEPKPNRRAKTERLQIRCSPAERETIEQAATAAGLTVSAYVVRAAIGGAR